MDAGAGMGGGNDEREQTLNQILTDSWISWQGLRGFRMGGVGLGITRYGRYGSWPKYTKNLLYIWFEIKMPKYRLT